MKRIGLLAIILTLLMVSGCANIEETPSWAERMRAISVGNLSVWAVETEEQVIYVSEQGIECYNKSTQTYDLLVADGEIKGIQLVGDMIYFYTESAVKQLAKDGTVTDVFSLAMLDEYTREDIQWIKDFFIHKNKLYIISYFRDVYLIDLKFEKAVFMLEDVRDIGFVGTCCYFIREGELCVFDLLTGESRVLLKDREYAAITVAGEELYLKTWRPEAILRYVPGGNAEVLMESNMMSAIDRGYVSDYRYYYTKHTNEGPALFVYDMLQGTHTKLAFSEHFDGYCSEIVITRYSVVYMDSNDRLVYIDMKNL